MQPNLTDTLRHAVVSVLGAPPDPSPLLPETLSVQTEAGYRCEHIKFQVSPNDWSYAYLLIPEGLRSAAPVVYCHHHFNQDFTLGKAEIIGQDGAKDKQESIAVELVRQGYVVFAPDAIGFGERRSPESDGLAYDMAHNFHEFALRLLRGETLLRKVIWDISRGIDYLETRTEVDSHSIGFLGRGYGGKMAVWAMALEPRIKAGVAHGGIISYREHLKQGEWFQVEFVVPRLMQVADMHHILTLVAPRPFLISSTLDDPQGVDTVDIYQKALPAYQRMGVANRLALYRYPGGDIFERAMRYNAYNWLQTWLMPF